MRQHELDEMRKWSVLSNIPAYILQIIAYLHKYLVLRTLLLILIITSLPCQLTRFLSFPFFFLFLIHPITQSAPILPILPFLLPPPIIPIILSLSLHIYIIFIPATAVLWLLLMLSIYFVRIVLVVGVIGVFVVYDIAV